MCPERSLDLLTQSFDNRDYPDSTTTRFAGRNINIECLLQPLRLGHRGVTFVGRTTFCITYLKLVALATFCRCYQGKVLAIRREHALEPGQVNSGLRH